MARTRSSPAGPPPYSPPRANLYLVPCNPFPELDDVDMSYEEGLAEIDSFYGPSPVPSPQVEVAGIEHVEAQQPSGRNEGRQFPLQGGSNKAGSFALAWAAALGKGVVPPSSGGRSQEEADISAEEKHPRLSRPSLTALFDDLEEDQEKRRNQGRKHLTRLMDGWSYMQLAQGGGSHDELSVDTATKVRHMNETEAEYVISLGEGDVTMSDTLSPQPGAPPTTMLPPASMLKRVSPNELASPHSSKNPKLSDTCEPSGMPHDGRGPAEQARAIHQFVNGAGNVYEDRVSVNAGQHRSSSVTKASSLQLESDEDDAMASADEEEQISDHGSPSTPTKSKGAKRAPAKASKTTTNKRRSSSKPTSASPGAKPKPAKGQRDLKAIIGDSIKQDLAKKSSPRKTRGARRAAEAAAPNAGAAAKKRHSLAHGE